MPKEGRFDARELAAYHLGYQAALVVAVRVATFAEERFKMYARTKRIEARRRK